MPTRILILESPAFKPAANLGTEVARADYQAFPAIAAQHNATDTKDTLFVLAPAECRLLPGFDAAVKGPNSISLSFFHSADDVGRLVQHFIALASDSRSTGLKECLPKGSTIYSETFFNANAVGSKLDPCFAFARRQLPATSAVGAWGSLQALLFFGLQSLPELGEKGTGERVDAQIGGNASVLALTVRFDLPEARLALALASPLLSLPRASAGLFEARYLKTGAKIEFNCLFYGEGGPKRSVEMLSFRSETGLESNEAVKNYVFKGFNALGDHGTEEKCVVKGGFRKKFSEHVDVVKAVPDAAAQATVVKGEGTPAPQQKVVVSGASGLGKAKETVTVRTDAPQAPAPTSPAPAPAEAPREKSASVLESKIAGLEATIHQRDELIVKLNKEIEEIKDPLKMGVISGIKDNQLGGLKDTILRLNTELEESQKREKELISMVDKAVQMKDDAMKRIRELEVKLKQSSGGKNSQVAMLEKQLEEQKRQNKEMSKRVTGLIEQLQQAGIRPAA